MADKKITCKEWANELFAYAEQVKPVGAVVKLSDFSHSVDAYLTAP